MANHAPLISISLSCSTTSAISLRSFSRFVAVFFKSEISLCSSAKRNESVERYVMPRIKVAFGSSKGCAVESRRGDWRRGV